MSLFESIVQELDQELKRLQVLRTLVAGLSRTKAVVRRYTEAAPALVSKREAPAATAATIIETTQASKRTRKPRRDVGTRRGPRAVKAVVEPTALAKSVPAGPVVFYPGRVSPALGAEINTEPTIPPAAEVLDLDAQSRQLAARWTAVPTA